MAKIYKDRPCEICGTVIPMTTQQKYCKPCFRKNHIDNMTRWRETHRTTSKEAYRPLTASTEFFVSIWDHEKTDVKTIGEILSRPVGQVKEILHESIASGRYEQHIKNRQAIRR